MQPVGEAVADMTGLKESIRSARSAPAYWASGHASESFAQGAGDWGWLCGCGQEGRVGVCGDLGAAMARAVVEGL